jgi:hypothetical protein
MKTSTLIRYCLIAFTIFAYTACEKTIPADEPVLTQTNKATVIGDFDVKVQSITDHQVYLTWTAPKNAASYDIVINDSLALHNIKTTYYNIAGLKANTDQKIIIRAVSTDLSVKTATVSLKTMKELYEEVRQVFIDKYQYTRVNFNYCTKTKDGGYLLTFYGFKNEVNCELAVKTDKDMNVIWKTELVLGYGKTAAGFRTTIEIKTCSDGGYLIVNTKYVVKLSATGSLLWKNDELLDKTIDYVNGSIELSDGSFWVVGSSSRNWTKAVSLEYTLTKLSRDGNIIWKKYWGSSLENSACKIIKKADGNYFIVGTTETSGATFNNLSYMDLNISLQELDGDANILTQKYFLYCKDNKRNSAQILNVFSTEDNHYVIVAQGDQIYGETQVIVVSANSSLIWDYRGYNDGETMAFPRACNEVGNKTIVVAWLDYNWYKIKEFNSDGTIYNMMLINNLDDCLYIDKDENGRYVYITTGGYQLKINPDGYISH